MADFLSNKSFASPLLIAVRKNSVETDKTGKPVKSGVKDSKPAEVAQKSVNSAGKPLAIKVGLPKKNRNYVPDPVEPGWLEDRQSGVENSRIDAISADPVYTPEVCVADLAGQMDGDIRKATDVAVKAIQNGMLDEISFSGKKSDERSTTTDFEVRRYSGVKSDIARRKSLNISIDAGEYPDEKTSSDAAAADPEATGEDRESLADRPFYAGTIRLLDYATRARSGMTAKFMIVDQVENRPHPFRGVKAGFPGGQRLRAMVCTVSAEDDPAPVYNAQAMLSWWSEDPNGSYISLKLDDGPDGDTQNPFEAYRVDKQEGEEFAFAVWLIDDDETTLAKPGALRGMKRKTPAQQSQILCKTSPEFQEWAIRQGGIYGILPDPSESSSETAARFVRTYCEIESRADFATNPLAVSKWEDIYYQFLTWRNMRAKLRMASNQDF